jgi:hypothetical protein
MKLKFLLFLLIILQSISCNKRYIFLKKVRVPHSSKKESVAIEQKRKTTEPFHPGDKTGFDSIENTIPDEANSSSKPILILSKQWRNAKPQKIIQPEIKTDKNDRQKKNLLHPI